MCFLFSVLGFGDFCWANVISGCFIPVSIFHHPFNHSPRAKHVRGQKVKDKLIKQAAGSSSCEWSAAVKCGCHSVNYPLSSSNIWKKTMPNLHDINY